MARQLALDLTIPPALSRADFLTTAANRDARAMLDAPARWPQGRLLLIGGPGAGKTHLAGVWAAEHGAHVTQGWTLTPANADELVPEGGALVIEDAEEIGGQPEAEQGLFHLWNLSGARQALLLISARAAPRDWGCACLTCARGWKRRRRRCWARPMTRCCRPCWSSCSPTDSCKPRPR